ncbi:MAG: hypothetical protein R3F02_04195 [Thiolinea sp.]
MNDAHEDGYQRRQQLQQERTAATLRALSREPDLYFRARQLYRREQRLSYYAPHLRMDNATGADCLRGIGDGLALRVLHSDDSLHRSLLPDEPLQAMLFETLEQLRVESLADGEQWPGVRHNLQHNFSHWAQRAHDNGLTEGAVGLLVFTVLLVCRSQLSRQPIPEALEDPLEATRAGVSPMIGDDLAGLKRQRRQQAEYAQYALSLARTVYRLAEAEAGTNTGQSKNGAGYKRFQQQLQLLLNTEQTTEQGFAQIESGESRAFNASGQQYQIFSREFDQVLPARSLIRDELLQQLRQQLDQAIRDSRINLINRQRLVQLLQQTFALPDRDGWEFGLDSGYPDGRRLSRLVASPDERLVFKQEAMPLQSRAAVTFLLDCSGSMRRHATKLAVLLEVFSRALEQVGVHCEILGFTTRSWNGGRALKSWYRQGRPAAPGRLNELCHLIFKTAEQPWRKARQTLPVLLKPDIYRESVDGEAVEWACGRLLEQDVPRRILTVISDGCPMDTATRNANDAFYLDNHLQQVVQRIQQRGQVEISGIGVGLDLSPYYRRHLAVDADKPLDYQLVRDIIALWRSTP